MPVLVGRDPLQLLEDLGCDLGRHDLFSLAGVRVRIARSRWRFLGGR